MTDEEIEAIRKQAMADTEDFLRGEYVDRRRQCLFGGGGFALIGLLMGGAIGPMFALDALQCGLSAAVPLVLSVATFITRFRCPRCEKPPVSWASLQHYPGLSVPGCSHCGLSFEAPEEETKN